jgi:hypothetical protein
MTEPKAPPAVPIPDVSALLAVPEPPAPEIAAPEATAPAAAPPEAAVAVPIPLPMLRAVRGTRSVAPTGELQAVGGPRLLYLTYVDTFSGLLRVTSAEATRTLCFSAGLIVGASSTAPAEELTAWLLREGHLTPAQLIAARDAWLAARDGSDVDGHLLAATGLDAPRLDALRRGHCEAVSVAICGAATGSYALEPGVFRPEAVRLHPLAVLWRGIREHADPEALVAFFAPHRGSVLAPTPRLRVHWKSLGPALKQAGVSGGLLAGKTTFGQALDAAPALAPALYCLWVTEMATAAAGPLDPAAAQALVAEL